ncbi:hypothetical protein [Halobacillus sp. A5]|uniref:hypothetical protein n=1 Tax=Halobacillus sp. A5 TaxID=2880263 RepID=UPI0020A6A0E4|nr:hypothetical protein [Halobacillus sp. A5]MCP3026607.1 hypothetical protein [Halobacillus sp. A5]
MEFAEVDEYLHKLHYTDVYTTLDEEDRERVVFTSKEMLKRHYDEDLLSTEAVALQSIYLVEGESEEFSKFKRHGVKSMGLSGMSFSFEGNNISPEVVALIEKQQVSKKTGAAVGRLF